MSDEGLELLDKVIKNTAGNPEKTGLLSPEQEKTLMGTANYEPGRTTVYRQFVPMRDAIEYTVYYVVDGKKHRVDFEIEMQDFVDADGKDLERQATVVAKAVIRSHIVRDRWDVYEVPR